MICGIIPNMKTQIQAVFAAALLMPAAVCRAADMPPAVRDGTYTWGGRDEHPALVNPVVSVNDGNVISLRGEWEFSSARMTSPWRGGPWCKYYKIEWKDSRTIRVPGCWEAQGVGTAGMAERWDASWDHNAKPIRHKHMGEGWYRRSVDIPAAWAGKRVWLKIGGVKSKGWFWVNGSQVALVDNYCGTCKYEITDLVKPGEKAVIVAQASNVLPSRKGLMSAMNKWGGLYRDVELEATPATFIDDAWVRGLFDEKCAEAHVLVTGPARADGAPGAAGPPCKVRLSVDGAVGEADVAAAGETIVRLPLVPFRAWSPGSPNLYTARVDLVEGGRVVHTRLERFGVRKFEVRGNGFLLNGRPFYVRGFGDDHVYPITGISPAERGVHRANLARAREAGFNFVRLHTHCELPEYFEAADELGIMIQAELPYYCDVPTEGFEFDPRRDVIELWRNYRRHPSFAVYCMGNEGSYGHTLDARMHALVKAMDPDRLKINQDSNLEFLNTPETSDYLGGPINVWKRGSYNPARPFVAHEYLNLCVKLDSRDEKRYTGAWLPPVTRKARADWLAGRGLDARWGDRLQDAQHALQRHYQKRGVESARKDPYCDGYSFWTIVDVVVGQRGTYTAQGLFNPFWDPKRTGFTAKEFAVFNSPSCVLMDVPGDRRVYTCGEEVPVEFLFARYGEAPLRGTKLDWKIDCGRAVSVAGAVDVGDVAPGPARTIASVKVKFPVVDRPCKAVLTASLGGVANSWDFWVFPVRARRNAGSLAVAPDLADAFGKLYEGFAVLGTPAADRAKAVVARGGSREAKEAEAKGRATVIVGNPPRAPNVSLGWWWMGSQVGTAILDDPAFGQLPHEGVLSPLLFRVVGEGAPLGKVKDSVGEPLMIAEGGTDCFVYLARRKKAGAGTVLESFGLDLLSGTPEGTAILDGMIDAALSAGTVSGRKDK